MYKIILPPCVSYVVARVSLELSCRQYRQCIQRRFPICDFARLRYCYIYHRGLDCYDTHCGRTLSAGFGIAIKYVDRGGKKRSKCFEGSVIFHDAPGDFDLTHSTVRFTNLACDIDCDGNMTAKFMAELCPCPDV